MREVAIMSVSKLNKPIFEALDLEGTKDEARELARAQVFLEAFYPGASVKPHPLGALWAFKVAAVPFMGQPDAVPRSSAARRKFFIAMIEKAREL
jgi:hypothetical protein